MKDQTKYIKAKISEGKEAYPTLDPVLWDRLYDLLWDSLCSVDLKPFVINKIGNGVEVRWHQEWSGAWAQFYPDTTDWAWRAATFQSDGRDRDSDTGYSVTYEHMGLCSFIIHDTPHYFFPDEVEKIVSTPDTFSREYYPVLKSYQYAVLWETNKYDGMLSGYCLYDEDLHYVDMVEETEYQRKRMYAIYQLSPLERMMAYFRHAKWLMVMNTMWLWKLYLKWDSFKRRHLPEKTAEEYRAEKEKFKQTHEIVGYFER